MPAHHQTQTSRYTTRQLFDLVADVERYPDFLPWCQIQISGRKGWIEKQYLWGIYPSEIID